MPAFANPTRVWRQEAASTLKLAAPLVLTNLTQAAIQATDVLLLGWLGPRSLAAGALGSNIYVAFLIFGMGLVTAASPLMSRQIGAMPHSVRDVRRTVRQTMWAAVTMAVPVMLILWHSETLLIWLGQEPALAHQAARFVRAIEWGFLPALFYLVLRGYVAALERPAWALLIGTLGVVFNAVLNYSLIFGKHGLPAMGVVGAGIGSSITQTMMFAGMAIVIVTHRRFRRYRLFGRFWHADWRRYATVWRLGGPIAMTLGLEITIFNAAVFLMGIVGTAALAAHAIAIQVASFSFMVPLGLSQAVTVRIGLALGRRDAAGITRAGWTAWVMGVGFMTCTAAVMWAIPRPIIGLFLDTHSTANAEVVGLAVSFLAIAAVFQIVDGAQAVGSGMLRGLHDTKIPMLFAAFGYWVVGLAVALWLGFHQHMGGVGIWIGLASGLAVVAMLMLVRWLRRDAIGLMGDAR